MNILDKIIESKKQEINLQKKVSPETGLKNHKGYDRTCNSLKAALMRPGASGIIAEFKQKSPSKGLIHASAEVGEVTKSYADAGASGLSVLTDKEYFGGSLSNLQIAREINPDMPILRKDFIIDEYQVMESKAFGADVILLIAACLEKRQLNYLAQKAKELGMEVLMEVHTAEELNKANESIDFIGVNNRNLKTFEVNPETSVDLGRRISDNYIKISESGLAEAQTIRYLRNHGFKGFLIGETFMKTQVPGDACKKFIEAL